jgi:hypothetical protein
LNKAALISVSEIPGMLNKSKVNPGCIFVPKITTALLAVFLTIYEILIDREPSANPFKLIFYFLFEKVFKNI